MSAFKKILSYVLVALGAGGLVLLIVGGNLKSKLQDLEDKLSLIKSQEDRDRNLGQYAINMMYKTRAATMLSDARKQTIARALVRVANDVYETEEHKRAFITVIAIESEFLKYAQSHTGPKGLSQVAKTAFKEGMASCGVTNLSEDDVWETDLNLYAGACYFRTQLEQNNNDPFIAIVAYNQGPNSKDIKTYAKNGRMNTIEALQYVAKFTFLKRTVSEDKQPNIPSMEDLSKPNKSSKVEIDTKNKATSGKIKDTKEIK